MKCLYLIQTFGDRTSRKELWMPSEGRRETYQSPLISISGYF